MSTPPKPIEIKKGDIEANNGTSRQIPTAEPITGSISQAEYQYRYDVFRNIQNAKDQRERPRKEFNGMSYTDYDEKARELDLAYVPPAKDKNDVRIVSGFTREKNNTALSVALSMNFDTECLAFDKTDTIIADLSHASSDLVEKSNQLEEWPQRRATTYRGQISRGTYFTMELQEFMTESRKSAVPLSMFGSMKANWADIPRKREVNFRTVELDPKMVFVGDIKEMELQKQPFVAVARVVSESEARSMFGAWDRWDIVPLRRGQFIAKDGETDVFQEYQNDYAVSDTLVEGYVEVVYFMRSLNYGNELAIYCNGVPMLPVNIRGYNKVQNRYNISGFPLTAFSASGDYPIVDWHFERIPGFYYSKGQPAKTQFTQDIMDFWLKFLVKKARRSGDPTLGNTSGMTITSDMLQPNNIISNINKGDLFPILPPEMLQGVTTGEASFYEMLKKEVDEKTMSREFAGESTNQYQTATAFTENKKAQLLRLGAITDGIIRGEMRRADLRLRNSIIPYWFSKEDKEKRPQKIANSIVQVYDSFTIAKTDKSGKHDATLHVADLGGENTPTSYDMMSHEDQTQDKTGNKTRLTLLDPDQIDFMRTLFYWMVKTRERDNDQMQKMMLTNDIATVQKLFPNQVNYEALKARWALVRNEDYEDWFTQQGMDMQTALAGAAAPGASPDASSGIGGLNASSMTPPTMQGLAQ